jgi:hypothetical protein
MTRLGGFRIEGDWGLLFVGDVRQADYEASVDASWELPYAQGEYDVSIETEHPTEGSVSVAVVTSPDELEKVLIYDSTIRTPSGQVVVDADLQDKSVVVETGTATSQARVHGNNYRFASLLTVLITPGAPRVPE